MVESSLYLQDIELVLIGIEERLKGVNALLDEMGAENTDMEWQIDQIGKGIDILNELLGFEDEQPVYAITDAGRAELERLEERAS